jgi:hypothetical protein
MIDDDEVIYKVLHDESKENSGIMKSIASKVEYVFFAVKESNVRLEMKKFLTLPFLKEEHDIKNDP